MTPSCISAQTNQCQVCIPPQPITLHGFAFKDLQPWISLLSHRALILLLSINEIILAVTRLPLPHHLTVSGSSFFSERSSALMIIHYSASPTPCQHFLFSALPTLNLLLGPSHWHSPLQRPSWLVSKEVDHCVTSPDGCTATFESSHPRLTNNLPFGELVPP
ncbi:hypothetical protein CRENBAI_015458 [Crenichthys baileyi]|uniref:Uncharacterized protein n=1 Tax=Crenichthys baileyi TaxID=28760 RepID=A0AAV9RY18_9TELE